MKRVERFKEIRIKQRRIVISLFLFFFMIISGICISDYSVNSLMKNENRIGLVTLEKKDASLYLLNILNIEIYINTRYVEEDFKKVKSVVAAMLNGK